MERSLPAASHQAQKKCAFASDPGAQAVIYFAAVTAAAHIGDAMTGGLVHLVGYVRVGRKAVQPDGREDQGLPPRKSLQQPQWPMVLVGRVLYLPC
ncbi:hypothetical protein NDU88_004612 [Pleurodeles waltl]|uniref:Uncharacterized protein n=1 Tax=Pleurodeles waltl TaxID=8319 RepID=A0AAV7MVN2_PLEWA|nr:hypothetical protein NDU88_004612 [Pleurodeles waltl]